MQYLLLVSVVRISMQHRQKQKLYFNNTIIYTNHSHAVIHPGLSIRLSSFKGLKDYTPTNTHSIAQFSAQFLYPINGQKHWAEKLEQHHKSSSSIYISFLLLNYRIMLFCCKRRKNYNRKWKRKREKETKNEIKEMETSGNENSAVWIWD